MIDNMMVSINVVTLC